MRRSQYAAVLTHDIGDYHRGATFSRADFLLTLARGYWPRGSVWRFAIEFRGERGLWRVDGAYLCEVNGDRVYLSKSHAGIDLEQVEAVPTFESVREGTDMKELQQKWIDEFRRRAGRHIAIFRVMAHTVNDLAMVILGSRISGNEIRYHDQSKFGPVELSAYARQFCGPKDDPKGWSEALYHHYLANLHHPEHWAAFSNLCTMPDEWVMAMVADWLAASYQYTGSLDMQDWLDEHMGRESWTPMTLETERRVTRVLTCLGYVPNWDNAPLWGWVGRDWVPDVMAELSKLEID